MICSRHIRPRVDPSVLAINARMRRIDLFSKLIGPLAISSIAISSTLIAIWATLGMSLVSVVPEYFFIEQVSEASLREAFKELIVVGIQSGAILEKRKYPP